MIKKIGICICIFLATCFFWIHFRGRDDRPPVVTSHQDVNETAKALNVATTTAQQIAQATPRYEYSYRAPSVDAVRTIEAKAVKEEPRTDKTIIEPHSDRVDVYRITLKHEHKIKAGVMMEGPRAYPAFGYQAGRFEAVVALDGVRIKTATVLYTVKEW